MSATGLNGWTAKDLDHLAEGVHELKEDVSAINVTLAKMQSDETVALRSRVQELEGRPRAWLFAMGSPILAAFVAALLTHAF